VNRNVPKDRRGGLNSRPLPPVRTAAAVAVCKITRNLLHILGRGGTALPGRAAMVIRRDLLEHVSRGMDVILVTGTNGKTTAAAFLSEAMRRAGREVLANRSGANLVYGVTAEFAAAADLLGRPTRRYAVIECDEGALRQVAPMVHPRVIVVTNIFRDQLDRYGEVMHTLEAVREGIRQAPDAVLCLNADDSLTASLALEAPNPVVWFGLEAGAVRKDRKEETDGRAEGPVSKDISAATGEADPDGSSETEISDARYCIRCGAEYRYHYRTYAHLGGFYCPSCGFTRSVPDVAVTSIERIGADGSLVYMRVPGLVPGEAPAAGSDPRGTVAGGSDHAVPGEPDSSPDKAAKPGSVPEKADGKIVAPEEPAGPEKAAGQFTLPEGIAQTIPVRIGLPALYNIYNAAAAMAAYTAAGLPRKEILDGLAHAQSSFGRMESFRIRGVPIRMILVKNPAGCNQALDYLCALEAPCSLVLGLNDLDADGHDISWIWDADYEKLCGRKNIRRIYVWGRRAEDLQLRLKYAGLPEKRIRMVPERSMRDLLDHIYKSGVPVYILPNYTTMLPLRDALRRAAGKDSFWKG